MSEEKIAQRLSIETGSKALHLSEIPLDKATVIITLLQQAIDNNMHFEQASDILKGVFSGHKSVTSIVPNNSAILPKFSVFMNFHPNLSDSRSGLISGLELLLHWHTMVTQQ